MIKVSKMTTVTVMALHRHGKRHWEEMSLCMSSEDWQWECWADELRQTVPGMCSSNRKYPVTDGCGGQSVMMKWMTDGDELRCSLPVGVH